MLYSQGFDKRRPYLLGSLDFTSFSRALLGMTGNMLAGIELDFCRAPSLRFHFSIQVMEEQLWFLNSEGLDALQSPVNRFGTGHFGKKRAP
jgi:hypothetical protein